MLAVWEFAYSVFGGSLHFLHFLLLYAFKTKPAKLSVLLLVIERSVSCGAAIPRFLSLRGAYFATRQSQPFCHPELDSGTKFFAAVLRH